MYNPLEAFLNPSLRLNHGNGELPFDGGKQPSDDQMSMTAKNFTKLKDAYEAESRAPVSRRKNLGVMIRTLSSFRRTGVAVDPRDFIVKLPTDYSRVAPPMEYGLSKNGKIAYCTTIKDTAIGVSAVLLVRKVFFQWRKYINFR